MLSTCEALCLAPLFQSHLVSPLLSAMQKSRKLGDDPDQSSMMSDRQQHIVVCVGRPHPGNAFASSIRITVHGSDWPAKAMRRMAVITAVSGAQGKLQGTVPRSATLGPPGLTVDSPLVRDNNSLTNSLSHLTLLQGTSCSTMSKEVNPRSSPIPLPLPIVTAICLNLKQLEADATVAAIQGLSQSCHEVVTPILYQRVCLDNHSTQKLFGLWSDTPRKDLHLACQSAEARLEQETAHHVRLPRHLRLQRVLEYIQHITLDDFVPDPVVARILAVAQAVNSLHEEKIFSGLSSVTFSERFMRRIPREQWRLEQGQRSNLSQLRVLQFSPTWKEACFHWPVPVDCENDDDGRESRP